MTVAFPLFLLSFYNNARGGAPSSREGVKQEPTTSRTFEAWTAMRISEEDDKKRDTSMSSQPICDFKRQSRKLCGPRQRKTCDPQQIACTWLRSPGASHDSRECLDLRRNLSYIICCFSEATAELKAVRRAARPTALLHCKVERDLKQNT